MLVFIHGGYWRALDKSDFSFVAPAFIGAGAMVVVPNYALCPAVSIEHDRLQLVHALAWVWRHAAQHGGDPQRIVVAGHSAGGHLAAMLLSCRWKQVADDLPAQLVVGALSISGLYDLEPIAPHAVSASATCSSTPASVGRLSPAFFPRPKGKLYATVGGGRERGVPAPEPVDPRRLGPDGGAGVRDRAAAQPLQRAREPGRPGGPAARAGAAAAGPALSAQRELKLPWRYGWY